MGLPSTISFTLPNLFTLCTLDQAFNQHYESVRPEAAAWLMSYGFFTGKKQEHLMRTNAEALAGYSYPYAERNDFRTLCDVLNILYLGDMLTDEQDRATATKTGDIILAALASQDCKESDSALYKCILDVVRRLSVNDLPGFRQRLHANYKAHIDGLVHEADLRSRSEILPFHDFIEFRREVSGVRVCFDLIEFALGVDLPDEVFQDRAFARICNVGVDMVAWANDLYSFNVEQSIGIINANIITVFMKEYNMTLQEASDHLGVVFQDLMEEYVKNKALIRSYGPEIDRHVRAYVDHIGYWIIGNLEWSFKSRRYFGDESDDVRESGVVRLMSKSVWSDD